MITINEMRRGSKYRLQQYKEKLQKCMNSNPKYAEGKTWRDFRYSTFRKNPVVGLCRDKEGKLTCYGWADSIEATGWRIVGDSHEIIRLDHTGWYCNHYQDETAIGCVLQLPARNGKEQYIPVVRMTQGGGVTLYLNEITDDKDYAAWFADHQAESDAEECREANAKYSTEAEIEELQGEIVEAKVECRKLIAETKVFRKSLPTTQCDSICAAVKSSVSGYLRTIRENRERIKELQDNFWTVVEGF